MGASARPKTTLEEALERSIGEALTRVKPVLEEKAEASARLSELLSQPLRERERLINSNPSFQTYSLAVLVLEQSEKAINHSPATVVNLVHLARAITAKVASRTCGDKAALADLGAYALALEGNALRVSGKLQRALELFQAARQVQQIGAVDPDLMARVDHLESSLRRDLRQFDTALVFLDRAARLFKSIQEHEQLARTVINRSNVCLVRGDFDQALDILESTRGLACGRPYLDLCVSHNVAAILVKSGRPKEAAELLEQTRSLYFDYASPLLDSRRLWITGLIARDLDKNMGLASALLTETTNLLVDHGYNTSFAGLELQVIQSTAGEVRWSR